MYKAKMIFGGRKMFCTECGYKLEDDFKFCPNCGIKLMESEDKILPQDYMGANGQREITQEEIERLTEEIFWRSPLEAEDNARDLSKATGISLRKTHKTMKEKKKVFKAECKEGKHQDRCSFCGSKEKEIYERPGSMSVGKVDFLGEGYISSTSSSTKRVRCAYCGKDFGPASRMIRRK